MERRTSNWQDIVVLLFAMAFPSVGAWFYFVTFADRTSLPLLYSASKVVQFSIPAVWLFLFRRRFATRPSMNSAGLITGGLSGGVMVGVISAAYLFLFQGGSLLEEATPRILTKLEAIGAATPGRYLALALFFSVVHALLEEYYWRWFVFGQLRDRIGFPAALVASSLAFMSHHVIVLVVILGPENAWTVTVLFSLAIASAGGLWSWQFHRSGSLAGPWFSHILVDLGIMGIGYLLIRGFL